MTLGARLCGALTAIIPRCLRAFVSAFRSREELLLENCLTRAINSLLRHAAILLENPA
jgi:hypothetical protein